MATIMQTTASNTKFIGIIDNNHSLTNITNDFRKLFDMIGNQLHPHYFSGTTRRKK